MDNRPQRLGFPVKVMGEPDLKSNDSRRWQKNPHLKVSLEYLTRILDYLKKHEISMYRMSSDIAPYATHPDMPQFHNMVKESDAQLADFGRRAREQDIRLSFHPSQYLILNSPNPELVRKSVWDLLSQADMLDRMGLGREAVLVIHVGGAYGDRKSSSARWVETWKTLPEPVRRRLVLENDDIRFSASDTLWIHEHTGVPLVFDFQHFWCFNPESLELRSTFARCLQTWPTGVRPKMHFSSPRTEMRETKRKNMETGKRKTVYVAPVWTGHADFNNPFEFINFLRLTHDYEFDVMLESKAKDLALIRTRRDLLRYAPELALKLGLEPQRAARFEQEEKDIMESELDSSAKLKQPLEEVAVME